MPQGGHVFSPVVLSFHSRAQSVSLTRQDSSPRNKVPMAIQSPGLLTVPEGISYSTRPSLRTDLSDNEFHQQDIQMN